jgi:hypothetical protein
MQTSVQSTSITNIPNLQVSAGARQILNIVQSAVTSANSSAGNAGQTLQLCSVPNSTPGVIYTHKIPVTIAGANPSTQLISIPASISNNRSPVQVRILRSSRNILLSRVKYIHVNLKTHFSLR